MTVSKRCLPLLIQSLEVCISFFIDFSSSYKHSVELILDFAMSLKYVNDKFFLLAFCSIARIYVFEATSVKKWGDGITLSFIMFMVKEM